MKTAVRVFIIISIVSAAICILTGVIYGVSAIAMSELMSSEEFAEDIYYGTDIYGDPYGMIAGGLAALMLITGIIMFIACGAAGGVQLALSIIALKKLNKAQCSDDFSIGWRVVVLIFVNLIAGILLLCMKDKDFCDERAAVGNGNDNTVYNTDDLFKYKELLDAGAITQEEYDEIKRKILKR